jgi:peroxiredoxin Q/BCP
MAQLRQEFEQFTKRDTVIVVLGPENASAFKNYWEKNQLPFIGLPDEQKQVLNLYGQEVKLLKLGRMPAQMLIDKQGVLRFAHYGNSMQDIPESEEIFEILDQLQTL